MESLFSAFFSAVSGVCGHEATLHANFMHQLLRAGVPGPCIEREHPIGGKRVDLVVLAECHNRIWSVSDEVAMAFEFKGGAYNVRNALSDEIDADGYCADLDKLAPFAVLGVECWFVCTDMAELGIALSPAATMRIAAQCARRKINFAYHAQGESYCLIAGAGSNPVRVPLKHSTQGTSAMPNWRDCLPRLAPLMRQARSTEDTATGFVYHALRQAGIGTTQLSLETYFHCEAGASRMQQRPDICVFDSPVAGRFNLYRGGDRTRSNDGIKIGNLRALIEIKGSNGASRASAKSFASQIAADIDKLAQWRNRFSASGYLPAGSSAVHPDYVMIAFDNRKVSLAAAALDELRAHAGRQAVDFHYLRIAP
jgi:hypothetical protein